MHTVDTTTGQLAAAVRRLMGAKRAVQRRLTGVGLALPSGGVVVLDRLVVGGPARIGDLALAGRCHLSVTSRLVAELETGGYVARETDPLDGRSHLIVVTDRGREYLQRCLAEVASVFEQALAGWSSDERAAMAEQLTRLGAALDDALQTNGAAT